MLTRSTGLIAALLAVGMLVLAPDAFAQSGGKPGKPGSSQAVPAPQEGGKPGAGLPDQGDDETIIVPPLEGDDQGDSAEGGQSAPPQGCPYSPRRLDLLI